MAQLPTLKRGAKGDAVKQFQREFGLEEDGIAGPKTWEALSVYVVQDGDTLSSIAEQFLGDAARWPEIHEINRDLIPDPDKIHPGLILALPAGC